MKVALVPEFGAKMETPDNPVPREFPLLALSQISSKREEFLLCPVRALRYYLHRIESLKLKPTRLFVAPCMVVALVSVRLMKKLHAFFFSIFCIIYFRFQSIRIKRTYMERGSLQLSFCVFGRSDFSKL